ASWSFPLYDCQSRSKDILFIIDCRSQVQEQIDFIQSTANYLLEQHSLQQNISIMTFSTNEIIEINNLTTIPFIKLSCGQSFPIDDVFNASDVWFTSRKRPLVTMIFVTETLFTDMEHIIEKQKTDTKVDRLFFIPERDSVYTILGILFFYLYQSFRDLNIVDVYAAICKTSCAKNHVAFTTDSSMISYYHIANVYNMSYDQSDRYCREQKNSYLVSLETPEEISFLFKHLKESNLPQDLKRYFRLHLGIIYNRYNLVWQSGYPYVFPYNVSNAYERNCYFIHIFNVETTKYAVKDNIEFLTKNVFLDDCYATFKTSLVVCECHEVLSNPEVAYTLVHEASRNKNIVQRTHYIRSIMFLFEESSFVSSFVQSIQCHANSSNGNDYLHDYVCGGILKRNVEKMENKNYNLSLSLQNGVSHFVFENVDISDCMYHIKNKNNQTFANLKELRFNHENGLFCDKGINKLKSPNAQEMFSVDNFHCGTKSIGCHYPSPAFRCQGNLVHKCIKSREIFSFPFDAKCTDNSHLQNCENFTCPRGFVKCPKSYCIYSSFIGDRILDCPFGEDEFPLNTFLGSVQVSFIIEDLCIYTLDPVNYALLIYSKNISFHCSLPCPRNFMCISNRRRIGSQTMEYVYKMRFGLYNASSFIYPLHIYSIIGPPFRTVEFYGQDCKLRNFDFAFQYWNLIELLVLDLSRNEFVGSGDIKLITSLSKLKVLNISRNHNLTIDQNFIFPTSLEIIDVSYTKTSSLKFNVFENVTFLKHLNLSNTLVSTFQDMGIPEYFTLETLYIENVEMRNIKENFFRGLIINSELRASNYKLCCPQILHPNIPVDKCHAPVDAISSCKHLVGDILKRITIWTVGLITLVGNGIVLVYRIGWNREIFKKAYGLFVSGLAVSDFIMGIYLLLIAAVDIQYEDIYVLEDVKWRHSVLCQFAGFLSTISSETSTFFICLITLDRFLKITFPFGQYRFTKTLKIVSFKLVWVIGFLLALIPIIFTEWDIYSSNGLCLALPLGSTENDGWIFSFIVFVVLNFILFLFIAIGQILIFLNIIIVRKSINPVTADTRRSREDLTIAKKLALVALTDFMCWFPVGILGFHSLKGHIFDREVYAWIAVFVLPINSALNPIIYTIPAIYQKCRSYILMWRCSAGNLPGLKSTRSVRVRSNSEKISVNEL
ncbi:G-protein coupled receptor GRL101, partial [Biomphalaria pfeifferi]